MRQPIMSEEVAVIVSVPGHSPLTASTLDVGEMRRRGSDWSLLGARRAWFLLCQTLEAVRTARNTDVMFLTTGGLEAVIAPFLPRKFKLVLWDVLLPQNKLLMTLGRIAYRRADHIAVIRRGDQETFRKLGVSPERLSFIPFPATTPSSDFADGVDGGYVYAAGSAHRDWDTLCRAINQAGATAIISTNDSVPPRPGIRVLPLLPPEEGRSLLGSASVVAAPLADTTLPVGPLILLDALVAGKPVVAQDVNGSRDYVIEGVTGFLIRPGDASDMARAIGELLADEHLRESMGAAARDFSCEFAPHTISTQLHALAVRLAT